MQTFNTDGSDPHTYIVEHKWKQQQKNQQQHQQGLQCNKHIKKIKINKRENRLVNHTIGEYRVAHTHTTHSIYYMEYFDRNNLFCLKIVWKKAATSEIYFVYNVRNAQQKKGHQRE